MPSCHEGHRRQWADPGDRTTAGDGIAPTELLSLRQQRAVELRDHPHAVLEERIDILLKAALTWAQRLKRVFAIDIEVCRRCGGRLRVIASIEEPEVIERILEHLGRDAEPVDPAHPSRAPPEADLSL